MNLVKQATMTDMLRSRAYKGYAVHDAHTVLGMSEARSAELSRAMMKAIETIEPKKQRFVKAL